MSLVVFLFQFQRLQARFWVIIHIQRIWERQSVNSFQAICRFRCDLKQHSSLSLIMTNYQSSFRKSLKFWLWIHFASWVWKHLQAENWVKNSHGVTQKGHGKKRFFRLFKERDHAYLLKGRRPTKPSFFFWILLFFFLCPRAFINQVDFWGRKSEKKEREEDNSGKKKDLSQRDCHWLLISAWQKPNPRVATFKTSH